jgi:DtxR family Mn-dependent transcriptional regulator
MQSLTEENYLKAIYLLTQKINTKITPTAIAEKISVNPASVVDMIKKLSEKKLIEYNKAKGAKLTDTGYKLALNIVRNHRLWEVFLSDKLGYSWDVVHEIAEQLEHIRHSELSDRLDAFLGFPEYDPHGDPIPKSDGAVPNSFTTVLSEINIGKKCRVVAVKDTSTVFLQYLQQLSISIGTTIEVLGKIQFDGSMNIQINSTITTNVSRKFGENLLVD